MKERGVPGQPIAGNSPIHPKTITNKRRTTASRRLLVAKDFRFGVALWAPASRSKWQDAVRRADDYGYDVVQVPDHVGASAPFPALLAAAEVTKMRIGTYVLNAGFYKPALLARDVAALNQFTDGRLELGLGAGYVREEFEAAELPFPTAKNRIEYLAHLTAYLREHLPTVPILIAGSGDRLVTLAAQRADIIGLTAAARTARPAIRSPSGSSFVATRR